MQSYFDVKQRLAKYNICMNEDIQKFVKTVKGIAEYGYEPPRILKEFVTYSDLGKFIDRHYSGCSAHFPKQPNQFCRAIILTSFQHQERGL
jgi:hypothetical protein